MPLLPPSLQQRHQDRPSADDANGANPNPEQMSRGRPRSGYNLVCCVSCLGPRGMMNRLDQMIHDADCQVRESNDCWRSTECSTECTVTLKDRRGGQSRSMKYRNRQAGTLPAPAPESNEGHVPSRWEHVAGAKYCENIFEHYIDVEGRVRHRNVLSIGLGKTGESSAGILSSTWGGDSSISTSATPAPPAHPTQRVVRHTTLSHPWTRLSLSILTRAGFVLSLVCHQTQWIHPEGAQYCDAMFEHYKGKDGKCMHRFRPGNPQLPWALPSLPHT